jgi:hypothetical protein
MIYYKVVNKDNTSCFISSKTYVRNYRVGEIVEAKKGSLGIFCFKDFLSIKKFCTIEYFKILKVESIGEASYPNLICIRHQTRYLNSFYHSNIPRCNNKWRGNNIPDGTICFPAVKVLEEVCHI